jgi:hypothetical protein
MFRVARLTVAVLLALAIAALPAVLDRCAESCQAHQHIVASTTACHHAVSTGTRLSRVPSRCRHDDDATALTAAKRPAPAGRAFDSIAAMENEPMMAGAAAAGLGVQLHSPPDSSATLDRRSLPLRV